MGKGGGLVAGRRTCPPPSPVVRDRRGASEQVGKGGGLVAGRRTCPPPSPVVRDGRGAREQVGKGGGLVAERQTCPPPQPHSQHTQPSTPCDPRPYLRAASVTCAATFSNPAFALPSHPPSPHLTTLFAPVHTCAPLATASVTCAATLSKPALEMRGPRVTPASSPSPTCREVFATLGGGSK